MFELDEAFESRSQWLEWRETHAELVHTDLADWIGERISAKGFREPLTGRRVHPRKLDPANRQWREGLFANGLNSRQRAVLRVIGQTLPRRFFGGPAIFATEAITAFAQVLRRSYRRFQGSEYGADEEARRRLHPIPHQDLCALTLSDSSFDLVTTNEVLEHIPDLDLGLREIARVLKPGGWHIGTHPFRFMDEEGDVRARLEDGQLVHLKEPERHHNPVDPEGGSLVFETPGWNILERARAAGFAEAKMRFVASEQYGYLDESVGIFILCARK